MGSIAPLSRVSETRKNTPPPVSSRDSRTLGISSEDHKEHGRYADEITSTIVLGQPGVGKTVFLLSQIYQHVVRNEGVFVLDPHDDLITKVLKAVPPEVRDNIVYINPKTLYTYGKGVRLNPLEVTPGTDKTQVLELFIEAFHGSYKDYWSLETAQTIRNIFRVLLAQPRAKLSDIAQFLTNRGIQEQFLKNANDEELTSFWKYSYNPSAQTTAMLSDIVSIIKEDAISKMFDCYESNINLDQAIAAHKCILVSLPESSMASRKAIDFVGSLLLTKLFLAGMKRVNRTPFYVYIDEAHQFTTSVTRDALAMLRKYGVFFTFATQTLDQYDNNGGYSSAKTYQSVLDMCQTIISFKIDKNTATELIPYFQPRYTINDFINIPKYSFIARVPADNNTEYPTLTSIPIPLRYDDKAVIERSLSNYGQRVDSIITQRP